jgi:hypothetical protein
VPIPCQVRLPRFPEILKPIPLRKNVDFISNFFAKADSPPETYRRLGSRLFRLVINKGVGNNGQPLPGGGGEIYINFFIFDEFFMIDLLHDLDQFSIKN